MADKEGMSGDKGANTDPNSQISDQERDLAQAALAEFNKGNYTLCLQHLSKLEASRPTDIKVVHNRAVAEYYKSDLRKTDLFKKNLNSVCQQVSYKISI